MYLTMQKYQQSAEKISQLKRKVHAYGLRPSDR